MNTNTASTETPDTDATRTRLVRPVAGRSIAGVAAGLARHLNTSVNVIRIAFVVAALFGGLGLVLYLAGWALIPDETENESIAERVVANIGSGPSWLGIALLIIGAVIILDVFTFMPGSLIWALVLIIVGFLLYRGDLGPRPGGSDEPAARAGVAESRLVASETVPPPAPPAPTPPPSATPSPPPPSEPPPPPSILGRLILGFALLSLGVLAVLDNVSTAITAQPRHYLALATLVLGVGLLVGAFIGRARWTILLGFFLVPTLFASPLAEVDWEGSMNTVVIPVDLNTPLPAYRSSVGSYHFDLSEAAWNGETVDIDVDLAAGEIVVVVPEGVAVTGQARVGVGAIETPTGDRAGVGELQSNLDIPGDEGTVDLSLDVGAGVIEIISVEAESTETGSLDSSFVYVHEERIR